MTYSRARCHKSTCGRFPLICLVYAPAPVLHGLPHPPAAPLRHPCPVTCRDLIHLCSSPAPVLFGLPHLPAASSFGASARHVPGDDAPMRTPCGCSMAHWNLLPVRRGIPSVHTSLSQRSCTIVIPLQQPSVNTVETPENSAHMLTDHMGDNLS